MPNRIIKDSIRTSDSIDSLSWFEEVFFYRLIVTCDDFGRYDARPKILKSELFPLKDGVTAKQISAALDKLSTVGMVQVYEYDQKPFLQLTAWGRHQQIRNKRSKFPAPAFNCNQLKANAPVIQSESESNPNPNPSICPEPQAPPASCAEEPPTITLTLNDKTEYPVTDTQINGWMRLYPAVDIMQELRSMKGWLNANPTRRKTKRGIEKFINGWLARTQDKGGSRPNQPETGNIFAQIAREQSGQS